MIESSQKQQAMLTKFTSVISLLMVQHPQIGPELKILRTAILKWYQGVETMLMQKNRMIMAAKSRGNEKMFVLFGQMQNYFENLRRTYSDPNLPVFQNTFKHIKQDFQFSDVDLSKFTRKYKQDGTMTDRDNYIMLGVDMQKFMKNFQQKQTHFQRAKQKISQLEDDNIKLKQQINNLVNQMRKDAEQYTNKVKELKDYLENAKQSEIRYQKQMDRKNGKYRSNPEIGAHEQNRLAIKNLLENAFDVSLVHQVKDSSSYEIPTGENEAELWRFLYCQALGIEGILTSLAQFQEQEMI